MRSWRWHQWGLAHEDYETFKLYISLQKIIFIWFLLKAALFVWNLHLKFYLNKRIVCLITLDIKRHVCEIWYLLQRVICEIWYLLQGVNAKLVFFLLITNWIPKGGKLTMKLLCELESICWVMVAVSLLLVGISTFEWRTNVCQFVHF